MGMPAKTRVEIKDFPGLITNMDPADVPVGAGREQVNVTSQRAATLEVRLGFRKVKFEDEG